MCALGSKWIVGSELRRGLGRCTVSCARRRAKTLRKLSYRLTALYWSVPPRCRARTSYSSPGTALPGVCPAQHICRFRRRRQNIPRVNRFRSEEHTSELQSLMRISYAVFCLKKKNKHHHKNE